jgi:archaemetzincin
MWRRHCFAVLALALTCHAFATEVRRPSGAQDDAWVDEAKAKVYESISIEDEKGFSRLKPSKPGDWLFFYRETPQTLERYKLATKIRPTEKRRTIVLQPLGTLDEEKQQLLQTMREYCEIFFQLPARIEKPIELKTPDGVAPLDRQVPISNRHGTYDKQYNGDRIMADVLLPRLPDDAVIYLGITMADLYMGDTNYVFGVGSFDKRVGVYSLCRYFPEFWGLKRSEGDDVLGLRRACKVLNHESGHMFGLSHCVFYRCSMNGSNSLSETDGAPMHYCPLCHRKLIWNLAFEPAKRYAALQTFYKKHGLKQEAEWTEARIARWKNIEAAEKAKKVADE